MQKINYFLFFCLFFVFNHINAQSFFDDFEQYSPGTYLCDSSTKWTTWNNAPGTAEDALIDNNMSASGKNSIYFESTYGGGPQDLVLPLGGVYNTGKFKFSSKWYISAKTGAYFNFQGGANVGSSWTLDVYMYDDGYIDVGGIYTNYPQDQWFELVFEVDLSNNIWEVFIDGTSLGTFSNWSTNVSYVDIYTLFQAKFWVDDVNYCFNSACLPDLELNKIKLSPNPICSNHFGDITIDLTNNGPAPAKELKLGISTDGQDIISTLINLNGLQAGKDTSITISNFYKTNKIGSNIKIQAFNIIGDRYILNDSLSTTIDVEMSPNGTLLSKGATFQGIDGSPNPDLLQIGKTNMYQITPPIGYSNSTYSSVWNISQLEIITEHGFVLPGTAYTFTAPNGSNNGNITILGSSNYLDSLLSIKVTVANSTTGCDSTTIRKLRIVPSPIPNFKAPNSACLEDEVSFENKSTIHSGFLTYIWYFGDGDTSEIDNPIHQYTKAGVYNVRLKATSQPYLITKDTIFQITINEIPDVQFRAVNKCIGTPLVFSNSSTVSNGTLTYDWDFGDGSSHSSSTNPTHLYNQFGAYKVTLNANANGCIASLTKTAYAFEKPIAAFTTPQNSICAKNEVFIKNESSISFGNLGTYWSFGDNDYSTQFDANHKYMQSGTYTIKLLSLSEFDCKDSITKNVVIKATPNPAFAGNQFCGKTPTVFTNSTFEELPSPTYNWSFSDGMKSNSKNITRSWPIEGPYSATLKAIYSNGCEDSIRQEFNVLIQPKASFTVMDICSGEQARFVNLSSGSIGDIDYFWDFGDGLKSNLTAPIHTYSPSLTTTYTVSLVASYSKACNDTSNMTITVNESPIINFTAKEMGQLNVAFTPSDLSLSKYEWFFGEGGSSTQKSPVYQYLYSGNFNVTLKAYNVAGCSDQITKKIGASTRISHLPEALDIRVFPNPNKGSFMIACNTKQIMLVEVYNVLGEIIYNQTTEDGELMVNLTDNAKGIYLVKVTINGISSVNKITVNE